MEMDKCTIGGGDDISGDVDAAGAPPKSPEGPSPAPAGTVGSEDMTSNGEELLEKLKVTEAMLEQEKQSRKESEEKYEKLKKKYAQAKKMFRNEWSARKEEWARREAQLEELALLAGEEEQLPKTMLGLKETLVQVSSEGGRKLEEIRRLTKKVEELKNGKKKNNYNWDVMTEKVVGDAWTDPALLFPEEVWVMIFTNQSDPMDLWNLCNTCQLFDTILSKWKTGWLLGQALPYLYKDLPGAKFLECRRICKSWKGAVDSFLENHSSLRPYTPRNADPRLLYFVNPMREMKIGGGYTISFSSSTENMPMEGDPRWNGNAFFIGRTITLKLGRDYKKDGQEAKEAVRRNEIADPGFGQMWKNFYTLLRSFGNEVWHLTISFFLNWPGVDAWERKMLPLMATDLFQIFPNLRKLYIRAEHVDFYEDINPKSLPQAPKLETLGTSCWDGEITEPMLTSYNFQLRKLQLCANAWKTVRQLEWPNLVELTLDGFIEEEDLQDLLGVRMPQLSMVGLDFAGFGARTNIQMLVNVINQVAATTRLVTIRLNGGHFYDGSGAEGSWDALAQVKTLEIEHLIGEYVPRYDFLLRYFPHLQNLNLFILSDDTSRNTSGFDLTEISLKPLNECDEMSNLLKVQKEQEIVEINTYMYNRNMYRSNIWELMPLLKVFSFQWDMYSRTGYEEYQAKLKRELTNTSTPPPA